LQPDAEQVLVALLELVQHDVAQQALHILIILGLLPPAHSQHHLLLAVCRQGIAQIGQLGKADVGKQPLDDGRADTRQLLCGVQSPAQAGEVTIVSELFLIVMGIIVYTNAIGLLNAWFYRVFGFTTFL